MGYYEDFTDGRIPSIILLTFLFRVPCEDGLLANSSWFVCFFGLFVKLNNPAFTVTQDESNRTWGRSSLFRPEEFDDVKKGIKKKGRTWGPSSVQSKERPSAAQR